MVGSGGVAGVGCFVGWLLWVEDFLDCVHCGMVLVAVVQ